MTTFPLATLSCTINNAGISAPPYADILQSLQTSYRNLYGQDVNLDADTQDGQWLAVLAAAFNESNNATIAAFNARSPNTAQGTGLSSIVKLNGLEREASSKSTVPVQVAGRAGTTITDGVVGDNQNLGTKWDLPSPTVIPDAGTITVTATNQEDGAITAEPNTITAILTPTRNWQSVNNADAAFPGDPVEVDSQLRQRQSISQSQAAQSPAAACLGALLNLPGVERGTYYENYTATTDGNGIPRNSICYVIGGGDVTEIAQTIQAKKTIGTGTFGTTTETVVDPNGTSIDIEFTVLELQTVEVSIEIDALGNYVDTTGQLLQQAVADYISSLPIGATVYINKVIAVASLMGSPLNSTFEVTAVELDGGSADVVVDFDKAPVTLVTDIDLVVS